MRVMKFGGTSVGNAARMQAVATQVQAALQETRVVVVASAVSGVTNLLVQGALEVADGAEVLPVAARFRQRHREIRDALGPDHPGLDQALAELSLDLENLLRGVALVRECSPSVLARISAMGERACCALLAAVLRSRGLEPTLLDPCELLPCTGDPLEATPLPEQIHQRFEPFRSHGAPLGLMPGFFGGDARGKTMLLGRGGSDWSAALVAAAMDADLLEIWTDVDGIYTADPRVVPEAFALDEVSFDEAMELAHFGAKVLHPRTIAPARDRGIPVRVCNSLRPDAKGTLVVDRATPARFPVRGISFLQDLALLNVAGPGMKGVPGVAGRLFSAMAARDISVVLITQASSEVSISFCVRQADADAAVRAFEDAFDAELASGRVDRVEVQRGLAILSIVGDGMRTRVGVAGTFLEALGAVGCNVVAIAQGSSERSISVVISARDGDRAMRHVHHRLFGTREVIELYLLGTGTVGAQVLQQLARRPQQGSVELRLCGVATSKRMLLNPDGIDPAQAVALLQACTQPFELEALLDSVRQRLPVQPVLIDCTSSPAIAQAYPTVLAGGMHVVTASKLANSGPMTHYRAIREAAARHRRRVQYETNVGAGLPVIDTLRNLLAGGDRVVRFEGILSGSLSFLCGLLEDGVPLSQAVTDARQRGFTEPDPRDDLSGLDVARKVLILARETGADLELADVTIEGVLPADFAPDTDVPTFLQRLTELDAPMAARVQALAAEGKVLRHVASFGDSGCTVGLQAVDRDHPLFAIRAGENAFSFLTEHYQPRPLVVRGYGAGAAVTAAGLLADVLKLARAPASSLGMS
jgi:aspartokinase/homoserine dehydrogenase 1